MYDVIVIGGGPSGLMAAVSAAKHGANTLLIDKGDKLGRKLAISGGGRCNVTNRKPIDELIQFIPGNGRFMYSPFSIFNNEDIINFFEQLGILLKEEDHGRMFPITDKAQTVVNTLINKIKEYQVEIRLNTPVKEMVFNEDSVEAVKLENGELLHAHSIIVAVGGMSVPHTGSTGDGYPWAKQAGHTITELYPTEVPITSNEGFIKEKALQGLSLRDVSLSVFNTKGKLVKTHRGDMIFTHFGLSGPAALRCSQYVVKTLKKAKVPTTEMQIDLFPEQSGEALFQSITKAMKAEPKKAFKNVVKGMAPERFLQFLFETVEIDSSSQSASISHEKVRQFTKMLKQFSFQVNGTLPLEKAFVTGGGVSVKEVEPKTMQSKKKKGLYFCGEVLDIHGYTGGYNITCAFSTGYTAGKGAAERILV
ncbi:BaiN/RdsA family NAD(P)/FAD-dependent oxidoreductase [Halalkalibacterium ligniniphilum]|uniref:NAD(P)/FAD-dependent oxidoreductase n=1 Tax=Halalkalibacterium ligniniphilum TaxID=1134413 RepID=UPI00034C6FA6|nr:NAD(P)/FAD-dependent oxidoreductase [Halalkalibacterium ligniniphilum]